MVQSDHPAEEADFLTARMLATATVPRADSMRLGYLDYRWDFGSN